MPETIIVERVKAHHGYDTLRAYESVSAAAPFASDLAQTFYEYRLVRTVRVHTKREVSYE